MGRVVNAMPRPLYHQERPGTHWIGGWVGPRGSLDGCGKLIPTRIWSVDRPAHSESRYTDWAILARAHFTVLYTVKWPKKDTVPVWEPSVCCDSVWPHVTAKLHWICSYYAAWLGHNREPHSRPAMAVPLELCCPSHSLMIFLKAVGRTVYGGYRDMSQHTSGCLKTLILFHCHYETFILSA